MTHYQGALSVQVKNMNHVTSDTLMHFSVDKGGNSRVALTLTGITNWGSDTQYWYQSDIGTFYD